ncbi:carbon-nitrogen hydrolase family protein [Acidihalobacter ferrooxydans]|uniref:Acyltransferase n=1 Tax=Acidihalobacter ferrooxydans TaxID=1765967 RepID=A0A1P8UFX9_9GAMM|nr:carbon-nitrogen hydrolase family protein [Acidihalobacter ferrooxydans]APZ42758.1 acyltransferase [Acidihalobacter ferrooxydans]
MRRVAAVQMASGPNITANLLEAGKHIAGAADEGARLVVLPENFSLMPEYDQERVAAVEDDGSGPTQDFLAEQAARHRVWLVGGTVPLRSADPERPYAACLVYGPDGRRAARYDKIHLFDVQLDDTGEQYHESASTMPGRDVVTLDTDVGRLGLAICYDLRFPELFRALLDRGAQIIAVPAAFTAHTGRAHWEPLLRARAIENLVYVIAAAQGGYHVSGRETYGHSMIVDSWGGVLAQRERGAGTVCAQIDPERQHRVRRSFPSIDHRRLKGAVDVEVL